MSDLKSWTEADASEAGAVLVRYAKALEARIETRVRNWEIYAAVYSEQLETSLRPSRQRYLQQPTAARNANLTFNVARSLVETEHATVTDAQPRPTFITEDGNQPEQDKAIELQRAIDGIFSDLRAFETFERCELDKCVLGTGVWKTHGVLGRPAIDRKLIANILVDEDLLGAGEDPKQIIERMEVSRSATLIYFQDQIKKNPDIKKAIMDAPALTTSANGALRADLICIYDAYTEPLDEENPGKHVMAVENYDEALFEEPWTKPRLPYTFLFWQRPTTGFYGIGIIEQVIGIQVEINRFYRNISTALKRWGGVTCLLPVDGKINTQQWTNAPEGKFIPYNAQAGQPVYLNGPKLSPEEIQWLNFQIENAYKVTGIPQNTAFAQREAGIPSAQGQREISQKAAARLSPQSKGYERAIVNTAWLMDDVLRELVEAGEKLEISTADQGALHKVNLPKALSLKPGTYKIDIFAGNLLSRHPASKREEVQEYAKAGVFTPEEVKALIINPDVTAALDKPIDVRGIYRRQIKKALDQGTYTRPEAFWPSKELGVKLYSDALFENQANNAPTDKLQILRDWLIAMRDIMRPPAKEDQPANDATPDQAPPPPNAAQQPPQQEAA